MRLWQLQAAVLLFVACMVLLARQLAPPPLPQQFTQTCAAPADDTVAEACSAFRRP